MVPKSASLGGELTVLLLPTPGQTEEETPLSAQYPT